MIPPAVRFVADQVVRIETTFEVFTITPNGENENEPTVTSEEKTFATSGFVLGENLVVTVFGTIQYYRPDGLPEEVAVKARVKSIFVYTDDGREYEAGIELTDKKNELLILKLSKDTFPHPGLEIDESPLEKYETLWLAGGAYFDNGTVILPQIFYDTQDKSFVSRLGHLNDLMKNYQHEKLMRTSGDYKDGMWGGPILNWKGKVVGVCVLFGSSLLFSVPADAIKKFIDGYFKSPSD